MTFELPEFLQDRITRDWYNRWLSRKAVAHVRRDRKRFERTFSISDFQHRIHEAVLQSNGNDFYTGKPLDWSKLSTYDNASSAQKNNEYMRSFNDLPTVDHEFHPSSGEFGFRICAWITNDCKNRLSQSEFIAMCRSVLDHHGRNQS